ncbi:hypothetical protein FA15DRAFT_666076 [Coprinopsis marcescibilis]|uniref:Uncharacterized protein n=1 Tax=Coprinopsis marcescibilis TaxID=230819 RepID=A0A5C3L5E1_COPMA|nr:hypothetical protein FA15DRAFT_666076 [Coprinopsis marcescibilis]
MISHRLTDMFTLGEEIHPNQQITETNKLKSDDTAVALDPGMETNPIQSPDEGEGNCICSDINPHILPLCSSESSPSPFEDMGTFATSTPVRTRIYKSRSLYDTADGTLYRTGFTASKAHTRRYHHSKPTICSFFSNTIVENAKHTRFLWRKRLQLAQKRTLRTTSRALELNRKTSYLRKMPYIEGIRWEVPSEFEQYQFLMHLQAKEEGSGMRDVEIYEDVRARISCTGRWAEHSDKPRYAFHYDTKSNDYDLEDHTLFKILDTESSVAKGARDYGQVQVF